MLLDFWYPVSFSSGLGRRPRRVTALGRDLVVWRTRTGRISVLSDLCVHRGGALSQGRVDGERIACPYHGWQYRTDGTCALIPAQPQRTVPPKARVDAYPVTERFGIVWAFLGDLPEQERPPLPEWPEHDEPGWRRIQGEFSWAAHVDRVVEGGLDFAHGPFVHRGTFGRFAPAEIPDFAVDAGPWSARAVDSGSGGLAWFLPSTTLTDLDLPGGRQLILQAHLPVDHGHTRTFWVALRNYATSRLADGVVGLMDRMVLWEDRRVVERLCPELLPFDLSDELHIRADALQVAYRRRRRELVAGGWPVVGDPAGVGPARVLPSPARRAVRGWVHRAAR